jgi:uncharacterized protein
VVAQPRHIPYRSCVVCRQSFPKRELVRVIVAGTGEIQIDVTGKAAGRGAYLCRKHECWDSTSAVDALGRALRIQNGEMEISKFEILAERFRSGQFK